MPSPRAAEQAARERRELAARELAQAEARVRRTSLLPLAGVVIVAASIGLTIAGAAAAALGILIGVLLTVRWTIAAIQVRSSAAPYKDRFRQAHAEHEAAFSRFFAAEQAGTADRAPSPPIPPTVQCPDCGDQVAIMNVAMRSPDGMVEYASTETDRDALYTHRIHCRAHR